MSNKLEQLNDNARVEVMKKAQAFGEILSIYQTGCEEYVEEGMLHYDMCSVLDRYIQEMEGE